MSKDYQLALHIFRRDLRLFDNTALHQALNLSASVLPCFIFDTRQLEKNDYKSNHAIQFMAESLQHLDKILRKNNSHLYCFYGIAEEVIANLLKILPLEAIFINRDYTPFSCERDRKIAMHCQKAGVDFHCYADALLHEPEEVLKSNRSPYTIFTHAHKYAQTLPVLAPQKNLSGHYFQGSIVSEDTKILASLLKRYRNPALAVKGGREEGLVLLKQATTLKDYNEVRNFPALNGTSKLSAHLKFGTVSIREVYKTFLDTFGSTHSLLTELYWRDFFTHIAYHYPQVFGHAFQKKYDRIAWHFNEKKFRAWCEGQTGFPIVDAGMRELNTTGFMHNRVRMIVASFLTKDLHIDWRLGEKYFAQMLTDYDPAVNNGNWQWAASTGCDAQPYFRIFNPWLQQKKFDPDCLYIKRFIPELARLAPKDIHTLYLQPKKFFTNYPKPIVDHNIESKEAKLLYAEKNIAK